jgi:Co/Zn/Cd efflux system component
MADCGCKFEATNDEQRKTLQLVLGINAIMLAKHRHGDVNFRASWIFSANDVIANAGVIASGVMVIALGSQIPDLTIGVIIAAVVICGGVKALTFTEALT